MPAAYQFVIEIAFTGLILAILSLVFLRISRPHRKPKKVKPGKVKLRRDIRLTPGGRSIAQCPLFRASPRDCDEWRGCIFMGECMNRKEPTL